MKKSSDFVVAVLASLFALGSLGAASAVEPGGDDSVIEDVSDGGFIEPDPVGDPIDDPVIDPIEDPGIIDDGIIDDGGGDEIIVDGGDVIDGGDDVGDGGIIDDGGEVIDVVDETGGGDVPTEIDDTGGFDYVDEGGAADTGEVPDGEVLELAGDMDVYTMGDFGEEAGAIEESAEPVEAFDIADEIGGDVESAREVRVRRR